MNDSKRQRDRTQTIQFKVAELRPPERISRMGFLTVIRGGGADLGRSVQIDGVARLGRDPECELSLNDMGVSWHHAQVAAAEGDEFTIQDTGSTNGTRLDGQTIEGVQLLRAGQKIFLGETVVRFNLADELEAGFQREVAHLVGTDPLTGLASKRVFDDTLDHALSTARPSNAAVAMLMMDMDGIKKINDTHGHLFGAHCIRIAGQIIGRRIGRYGHACRWGGDEFSAFLPGTDKPAAIELAEQIRVAIEQAGMEKDGIALRPTISIGVAVFPDDASKVLDLVAAADQALYRAKSQGRNLVSI